MLTPDQLDEIEAGCERVTPGPWGLVTGREYWSSSVTHCPHGDYCVNSRHDPNVAQILLAPDAAHIARLSPEVVRELVRGYREAVQLRSALYDADRELVAFGEKWAAKNGRLREAIEAHRTLKDPTRVRTVAAEAVLERL